MAKADPPNGISAPGAKARKSASTKPKNVQTNDQVWIKDLALVFVAVCLLASVVLAVVLEATD